MSNINETVIKEIVGSIRQLYRTVYLDSFKMNRSFGLTTAQSSVLRMLFERGLLSSADLSRSLFVTPSNITGIIDRLEKKGLVKRIRKANDRRVTLISLTDGGLELSKKLPDPIERKLTSGLRDMDQEQIDHLNTSMNLLLDLIDAEELPDLPIELKPDSQVTNPNPSG